MKKKEKIINRVSALLLSGVIVSGLIAPAFSFTARAEALPEILESSATVADCVMSYYAMSGSAVANTQWINTLYNSLGSSFGTVGQFCADGLLTYADEVWQPTQELISNIENASAYTELGLDTVFNVSSEEVAAGGGVAVATGGTTLAGATGCVASTGILPVLGGVTAAYWGGIGIGTIIAHKLGLYGKAVDNGIDITNDELLSKIPDGQSGVILRDGNRYSVYSATGKVYGVKCLHSGKYYNFYYLVYGNGNNQFSLHSYTSWNNNEYDTNKYSEDNVYVSTGLVYGSDDDISITNNLVFNSNQEFNNYVASVRANNTQPPVTKSPDLIGENGNLTGNYNNNHYTIPDMKPQIDPGTESGKPLSLEDWLAFANSVSTNNNQTNPIPDNTELFQELIDAVRSIIPNPSPGPGPNPGPDPGSETYPVPGPVPNPNPVPDPDYQPETKPQPDFTEKQTENQTDITEGDPWTTPDLLEKFPFCIPKDIYRVFTKLDSKARSAPHIQWRFHPNNMIDYTFDIDFSEWDSIATLLRTLELLAFIVGLAIGTRRLIIGG